jgi:hypothetical protein
MVEAQHTMANGHDAEKSSAAKAAPVGSNPSVSTLSIRGCHGKPLRGLMSTPRSITFEGRFGRMFPNNVLAATYGSTDRRSRDALMMLGDAMTAGFDEPKDGPDSEESGIPSLYTYFGQFIDHDITFDPVTTLVRHFDPDGLTDFRTPALDLDNVYGRGPDDQPYMYDGNHFILGEPLADHGAIDLPRNKPAPDKPARAIIGDPRNDENSIVSQFQSLMLRFHNRVVDDNKSLDFGAVQNLVRWHYQWVILNDFLPRIISEDVLESLRTNGEFDRSKMRFYKWRNKPFMPVEFSAAAYRLGHSMIRPGYRLNDHGALPLPIFPVSAAVAGTDEFSTEGLTGFEAMKADRGIDWGRFIDVGDKRAYDGDDEAKKQRLQLAYRLDASIVVPLKELPPAVASDAPPSLAQRNLLRGFELGLPSGQTVARAMGETPLEDSEIFIGKAEDGEKDPADSIDGRIKKDRAWSVFKGNCPLWTYILAEAAAGVSAETPQQVEVPVLPVVDDNGKEVPITVTTPQLGKVGGRIVAEVFLGMIFGDRSSYLSAAPGWTPTIRGVGTKFALRDIVAYALGD